MELQFKLINQNPMISDCNLAIKFEEFCPNKRKSMCNYFIRKSNGVLKIIDHRIIPYLLIPNLKHFTQWKFRKSGQ